MHHHTLLILEFVAAPHLVTVPFGIVVVQFMGEKAATDFNLPDEGYPKGWLRSNGCRAPKMVMLAEC